MPRIPGSQRTVAPRPTLLRQESASGFGAPGRALAGLGSAISGLGARLDAHRQKVNDFDFKIDTTNFGGKVLKGVDQMNANLTGNGIDHEQNVTKFFDGEAETFVKRWSQTDPKLGEQAKLHVNRMKNRISRSAANKARQQAGIHVRDSVSRLLTNEILPKVHNEESANQAISTIDSIVKGSGLAGERTKGHVREAAAKAVTEQLAKSNPRAALEMLKKQSLNSKAADDVKVTDKVLKSLITQESGGNPRAVSNKGAIGLMQVIPGTAREIARDLGETEVLKMSNKQLSDFLKIKENSIRYGTHYLNKQLRRYNGDLAAALIAYNGGPGRADNWLKAGRDDRVIPRESSDYYKAVMSRAGIPFTTKMASVDGTGMTSSDYVFSSLQAMRPELERRVERLDWIDSFIAGKAEINTQDPVDLKKVDGLFDTDEIRQRFRDGDEKSINRSLEIAGQYKVMPKAIWQELAELTRSPNAAKRSMAYAKMIGFAASAPHAVNRHASSKQIMQDAELYQFLTGTQNMEPAKALKEVDFRRTPEYAQRTKAFAKEWADLEKQLDASDMIDNFDSFLPFDEPSVSVHPFRLQELFAKYRDVVKDRYFKTRDFDAAKDMADRWVRNNFNVSNVTGTRTLMMHPPEKHYPTVPVDGGNHEWLAEQLKEDVAEFIGGKEHGGIFLHSDKRTELEIAAGKPATYLVGFLDEFGMPQIIPGRQVFKPNKFMKKANEKKRRLEREAEKALKEGRRHKKQLQRDLLEQPMP